MSSLAWIDFDEAERQRVQRIMEFFKERDSRDELGLGAIRDSIADHLFPGTSTIQTRLRYMLFIPWLYRMLEGTNDSEDRLRSKARELETRLIYALMTGGERGGVIGRDAGANLKRLPSWVYWAGLGTWGIRMFQGSTDSLLGALPGMRRSAVEPDDDKASSQSSTSLGIWHSGLPEQPEDLLDKANFSLTKDEAQFIKDRLKATNPDALLTKLATSGSDAECDNIWEHPQLSSFTERMRRLVDHGEKFSQAMHGGALLYNLQLSELRESVDLIERYREDIEKWAKEVNRSALSDWSLDEFWHEIKHPAHRVRQGAKQFVTQWLNLVLEHGNRIASSSDARELVERRERRLKSSRSRFANRSALDRWGGSSGVNRFNFRWPEAKSHLKDLANAG